MMFTKNQKEKDFKGLISRKKPKKANLETTAGGDPRYNKLKLHNHTKNLKE